jgi:predicted nucleic acid-binding protein
VAELYALDTSVYIRALRDGDRLTRLKRFLVRAGMRVRMNAVVALELQAGARTQPQERAVSDLLETYVMRQRVTVPSFEAYRHAGRTLAALAVREGMDASRSGSLVNDVIIAASCREASIKLITENVEHFAAVQRHLRGFRYAGADQVFG